MWTCHTRSISNNATLSTPRRLKPSMSVSPPIACRNASNGCSGYAVERGYCLKCAKENPSAAKSTHARRRHPLMDNIQWKRPKSGTRALMQIYNPQCQCIVNGIRCTRPMVIVHHIVSPFVDITKAHDPRNLVAVCREHHPTSEGDDPLNPRPYAPTRFPSGFQVVEYPHPVPALTQGQVHITADGRAVIG